MPIDSSGQFRLVLSKTQQGETVLKDPCCQFHYHWDFETNKGLALLESINGKQVNIALHPLGIEGTLDFMSEIEPTHYQINAECDNSVALIDVVISRIILNMNPETGAKEAAIIFNMDDSTIETTASFSLESAAKSLPQIQST